MRWADALLELNAVESAGSAAEIVSVEYDSRRVRPGSAFVAMRGGTTDGNRFVDAALANGAVAVVTDSEEIYGNLRVSHPQIGLALVQHGRRALAELSATVLGHPERQLAVSAVTGTNGKTTVSYLLEQILRSAGRRNALIGTIETRIVDAVFDSPHTTPEASDTSRTFANAVDAGATEVVMEMSSHALHQERVWGIPVDVAIFTNLTQDHLDYHGTMEDYGSAKARLFAGVGAPPPRVAIINANDPASARMIQAARDCNQLITYAVDAGEKAVNSSLIRDQQAHFFGRELRLTDRGTAFELESEYGTFQVASKLVGGVNVQNFLAAAAAAVARGVSIDEVVQLASDLEPAPGRFQTVENELGITIVVDYAHTDDALRNLISIARQVSSGRVITLFGCGGDRDRTKRPRMGRAAAEGSDLVVLTSDNPRSEDPMQIIQEALAGVKTTTTECIVEPDRAAAIELAIRNANQGDIVLLAGKGHEKVQVLRDRTVPFDDTAVAQHALRELVR